MNGKRWLALVALLCMVPSAYAIKPDRARRCDEQTWSARKCQAVPEGGSAAVYLLGVGITCLGAMFIRSRASKPSLL
jgi:hypothetical protein